MPPTLAPASHLGSSSSSSSINNSDWDYEPKLWDASLGVSVSWLRHRKPWDTTTLNETALFLEGSPDG